jgi:hypothetical protein
VGNFTQAFPLFPFVLSPSAELERALSKNELKKGKSASELNPPPIKKPDGGYIFRPALKALIENITACSAAMA